MSVRADVAALLVVVLGIASAATAQQAPRIGGPASAPAPSLSFSSNRSAAAPPAAKYEDSVSQRSFVLDRSGDETLMKFDDSPEVYALRATTAQRGDDFLRNDAGELMLRVTEAGQRHRLCRRQDGRSGGYCGRRRPAQCARHVGFADPERQGRGAKASARSPDMTSPFSAPVNSPATRSGPPTP